MEKVKTVVNNIKKSINKSAEEHYNRNSKNKVNDNVDTIMKNYTKASEWMDKYRENTSFRIICMEILETIMKDILNGTLLTKTEEKIMIKKVIFFRLLTWAIGVCLALISRFVFFNDNDVVWNIARHYNEIVSILSLIPVAQITLVVNVIRSKEQIINHILAIAILLICFLTYVCVWVACTGGV